MKASFFKRLGAFIIDYFIVIFIISMITMGFSSSATNNISKQASELISDYQNEKITAEEYTEEYSKLSYELQKSNISMNIVSITLYVGYFIIFATLNKGQTLGKKLFRIRVVNKENKDVKVWNMLVRSLLIYNLISAIFSVIFVNFLGVNTFTNIYMVIGYIEYFVMIVSFFMVTYKKDGRGLHDIIAGTNVIEEVRK